MARPPKPVAADPDADLVVAAKADPTQFRELYDRYFPRVHGYVRLRLRDRASCEDATSQVFLTALAQLHTFRGEGNFAAWLFRIAQHAMQRSYRAQQRQPSLPNEEVEEALAALPDSAPGPEEQALASERRTELRSLLYTLDPAEQHLLALRFGAGLSTQEIARLLGKSGVAVRVSLHRTLKGLRRRYNDED